MRGKALTLALLMIVSTLAGCVTEDNDPARVDTSPVDYPDLDLDGLSDEEEEQNGTDPANPDSDGDGVADGWEIYHGYDPLNGSDDAPRALCEWNDANWIEASDRGVEAYCDYGDEQDDDIEITQEDCERRNGTWVENSDRTREPYCDFGDSERENEREITQEDCERRNGTWTEAPDRPSEYYCDFSDTEDGGDELRFRYSNITLHIYHGENLENSTANYTIKIMLNHSAAPIHADNFRKHVMYGNYNNSTFHRIIDDSWICCGDFQNNTGIGGYAADWYGICNGNRIANQSDCPNQEDWNIPDEADNGLEHNPCVISMAKTSQPHTGGSQFFLLPKDAQNPETGEQGTHWLDGIHTVFGEVTEGCEYITTLSEVETDEMDKPVVNVVIFSATLDN